MLLAEHKHDYNQNHKLRQAKRYSLINNGEKEKRKMKKLQGQEEYTPKH